MIAILLMSLTTIVHADALDCRAACVVLQWGQQTRAEIGKRSYESKTRLVKYLGQVYGGTLEQIDDDCRERSQSVTWYKPHGETVEPVLIKSIEVDGSNEVNAVKSWTRLESCERFSPNLDDTFRYFVDMEK